MKRFYYISDDLDDLEQIEHDLEAGGIARPQICCSVMMMSVWTIMT